MLCDLCYLEIDLILNQGMAKSAFIANAWSGGISIGSCASCITAFLSSFVRAWSSDWSCTEVSPPLMETLTWVRVRVLRERVVELASELFTLQLLTGIREIGYTRSLKVI